MIGVAAGGAQWAKTGPCDRPIYTTRCLEQIRVDVASTKHQ